MRPPRPRRLPLLLRGGERVLNPEESAHQQRVHDALVDTLEIEGHLTGWIICYEALPADGGSAFAGHFYGPGGMTTWRAIGLTEWAKLYGLTPDDEDDE